MKRFLLSALIILGSLTSLRSAEVHLRDGRMISCSLVLYSANGVTISSPRLAKPQLIKWDQVDTESLGENEKTLQQAWLEKAKKEPKKERETEVIADAMFVPVVSSGNTESSGETDLSDFSSIRDRVESTWKASIGEISFSDLGTTIKTFSDRPLLEKIIGCLILIGTFLLVFLPPAFLIQHLKKKKKRKAAGKAGTRKKRTTCPIRVATGFALFKGGGYFFLSIVLPADLVPNSALSSDLFFIPLAIVWTALAVMNIYRFRTAVVVMVILHLALCALDAGQFVGQITQLIGVTAKALVGLGFLLPGAIAVFAHHRGLPRGKQESPVGLEATA